MEKHRVLFVLLICVFFAVASLSAFDLGDAGTISVTLDIDALLFETKRERHSNRETRQNTRDLEETRFGPASWDWWTDAGVNLEYTGPFFGGKVTVEEKGLGGLRAWVKFGKWAKLTAGTDIGTGYADSLDADPGLRVYNSAENDDKNEKWKDAIDPNNITQDKGLLVEGFFGPLTLAFAGFDHNVKAVFKSVPNSENAGWDNTEDRDFQYGAAAAYSLGAWGKASGAYLLQYKKTGNSYNRNGQDHLVPSLADAEVFTHNFGVYASLTPLPDMGVTLGYAGVLTKYLDEFYRSNRPVETLVPTVFKSGLNLNARYKGIPTLTLRTDHNYSFWNDKNYLIFKISGVRDLGLQSQAGDADKADVNHSLLWNGLGAYWTPGGGSHTIGVYLRNLLRRDTAGEYSMLLNQFSIEPKYTWKPSPSLELYVALNWELLMNQASAELNAVWVDRFVSGQSPRATRDSTSIFKIPVGLIMKY